MRTLLAAVTTLVMTIVFGTMAVVAATLGVKQGPNSIYDKLPRWWATWLLGAGGVRVQVHNPERLRGGHPRVFIANHLSWFDVLALAKVLPHYKFVGKSELGRIPLFGRAARAVGMIEIERENRKAAFESYGKAAEQIRAGSSVVVYPEGTRGTAYPLRPFKKGPFVLAIAAGVPVVPTLIYGALEVLPRGGTRVRPGTIHIHLLEPVETAGLTYDDRDALMRRVRDRMAAALEERYGIASPPTNAAERQRAEAQ
jgi:1-acyl-sn-glycerol-3-phosphate acyltransferase